MALFLVSVGCLFTLVLASIHVADGALIYSLDDPYIHLALARAIQEGSYGINVGEWASPSSSIVWPFLMALWPRQWLEVAPLIFNAVCCLLSVQVLGEVFKGPLVPARYRWLAALIMAFGLNLFGLVMTGMEHSLQVLLVLFVAWRLTAQRFDAWFYAALVLMPLVRYECLAISGVVAAYLLFTSGKVKPMMAVVASAVGIGAFSYFLHSKGLPWLPSSVLAKSAERSVLENVLWSPGMYVMVWFLHHAYKTRRMAFWMLFALPLAAFLLVGRSGWFGRYEAFMAAWLMVFVVHAAQGMTWPMAARRAWFHRAPARWTRVFVVGLPVLLPALWACTLFTPFGSRNIERQQAVMADIVSELKLPVAVNDLGLVALRSGQYVVDLWGLGSPDVLKIRLSKAKAPEVWMDEVTRAKNVHYAFIYEKWFPKHPPSWVKVGELKLNVLQITVGSPKVALFATTPEAVPALRAVLQHMVVAPHTAELIRISPLEPSLKSQAQAPGAVPPSM